MKLQFKSGKSINFKDINTKATDKKFYPKENTLLAKRNKMKVSKKTAARKSSRA